MGSEFHKDDIVGNPDNYRPAALPDEILRMIRLTGVIQASVHLTAPWGCSLPHEHDAVIVYMVLSGQCVAYTMDKSEVMRLSTGDALLVPKRCSHAMADSMESPLVSLEKLVSNESKIAESADAFLAGLFRSDTNYGGGGSRTRIVTLRLYIDKRFPSAMLRGLPRLACLPGFISRHQLFIAQLISQIAFYGMQGFTGQAVATRLAETILTIFIKDYLDHNAWRGEKSRLALKDPFLSKVLGDIHLHPEYEWSISRLAERAGLSRSAFIKRFVKAIGQTPSEFITYLRMIRAAEFLETTNNSVAQIAAEVGYGSEASFARAFHRWSGVTPGALRRKKVASCLHDEHR
ncbi:AraC family transcriptional regulator [Burkholderia gladioli]|uniref:AraC family transcriptional regulator n=1 Tax=Burkholderia gladioli TaxID=28095 RepID=UPI001641A0CC|nr:AraC family transcriptional regulator [Burkholderia gladioli]MDN7754853.1 AraC family transcriptional regulator [Burkholderia gladioli]